MVSNVLEDLRFLKEKALWFAMFLFVCFYCYLLFCEKMQINLQPLSSRIEFDVVMFEFGNEIY